MTARIRRIILWVLDVRVLFLHRRVVGQTRLRRVRMRMRPRYCSILYPRLRLRRTLEDYTARLRQPQREQQERAIPVLLTASARVYGAHQHSPFSFAYGANSYTDRRCSRGGGRRGPIARR